MQRPHTLDYARSRRVSRAPGKLIPVVLIAVLLALWFLIVEWKMVPELIREVIAMLH